MHRDAAMHERKIRKARAKKNKDLAERLAGLRPSFRLDHIVKERCCTASTVAAPGSSLSCSLPFS